MEPLAMITVRVLLCHCLCYASHQVRLSTAGVPDNANQLLPVFPTTVVPVATKSQGRVRFFVPRGTDGGSGGQGVTPHPLPHCSECFGHGVNKSIDRRCENGCVGNENLSTGSPLTGHMPGKLKRMTMIRRAPTWVPGFGKGAEVLKKMQSWNVRASNAHVISLQGRRHSTPKFGAFTRPSEYSTIITTRTPSLRRMAAMRQTKNQGSGNEISPDVLQFSHSEKPKVTSWHPAFQKFNRKETEDEEVVLMTYKKYIKTSSLVIVAAICGAVAITAFVVYRKHAKRKRKIHTFQSIALA